MTVATLPLTHPPDASDSAQRVGPVVQIDDVGFKYGDRKVLEGLNLQVLAGETFALLGPNGSGKSTLFRLLSTLVPIQSGSIRVFGHDVSADQKAVRKVLGVVFQAPALDGQLTAMENLVCHGKLHSLSGKTLRAEAADLLAQFGLSDRANDYVKTFSGGMRRKVELAKALLTRPKILVLDEPSTGLDPAARQELWENIDRLKRDHGVTVILTTHLMDEADRCDRVAIINDGKILVCDTPDMIKSSVGGDVITLIGSDLPLIQRAVRDRLKTDSTIKHGALRIERTDGHLFIPQLVEALPGMIDSVAVGRPTLDDAFIRMTGERLGSV